MLKRKCNSSIKYHFVSPNIDIHRIRIFGVNTAFIKMIGFSRSCNE